MENDKLIKDWLASEAVSSEKQYMRNVIAYTDHLELPASLSKEAAWDRLTQRINEGSSNDKVLVKPVEKKNLWLWWAVAAAAVFIIGYFGLFNRITVSTLQTGVGETLVYELPDHSAITLNASSELSFIKNNWKNHRQLDFRGEAFFEVEKGSKFTVNTLQGEVEVLGTSFNVFARPEGFEVTCFTGRVRVSHRGQEAILTPGMKASFSAESKIEPGTANKLVTSKFNMRQAATWKQGEFYFDSAPLSKVIRELERQYNIQFNVQTDISERYYSGFFSKTNLKEALQLVFIPMGLSFEITNQEVTVQ